MKIYSYKSSKPFILENGGELPSLEIVYHSSVAPESIATKVASGARVVWICHALTANSDPSEWWPDMVGEHKFFDTTKDIVICANIIGSCYGTTNPITWGGKPLDFPRYSVRDVVSAHIALRKYLGIATINILIGASVGGYQSLEWGIMEPECIDDLILIACNNRITPWQTAFNESQRMALEADSTLLAQESLHDGGQAGLRAARTIALLSYRSYDGYNLTQAETDEDCFQATRAASYHQYQGKKLADRFNAYCYYCITHMLDTHNIGRNRGGVDNALKSMRTRTLLISIDSDILFPPAELSYMASLIPSSKYVDVQSAFGHDGFLIEFEALQQVIGDFIRS